MVNKVRVRVSVRVRPIIVKPSYTCTCHEGGMAGNQTRNLQITSPMFYHESNVLTITDERDTDLQVILL